MKTNYYLCVYLFIIDNIDKIEQNIDFTEEKHINNKQEREVIQL
jgi:hypothetical protein